MAKIGRPIKFVIRLTPEERTRLDGMIHCGKGSVNSALKARILLKADVSQSGPGWSDERIAEALETSLSTVLRTRRLLVDEGLDAALSRKKSSWSPPRTFDGEAEAKLIALACTKPPQGYAHWTLRLLEQRVVELGIVEAASYTTIYRVLTAIPDIFFLLFIIMLLYLFFKNLFRAIFSPKICLPSGKTISSGKNDAEFVPQTSIDAGNA